MVRFFNVGRSAASVESVVDVSLVSVESEVRRCIVGRLESSDELDPEAEPDPDGTGVEDAVCVVEAVESVVDVSPASDRRWSTGRSGSSDAVVVEDEAAEVFAGVESAELVESEEVESVRRDNVGREESVVAVEPESVSPLAELSESVRRRIVGREESSEEVDAGVVVEGVVDVEGVEEVEGVEAAGVDVADPELASEPSESLRRRIVGREESSAEAVVDVELSVLLPSFGRFPPLATTCGNDPLFRAVYTVACDAGLNFPYPIQPSSNCVTLLPSRWRSYANWTSPSGRPDFCTSKIVPVYSANGTGRAM